MNGNFVDCWLVIWRSLHVVCDPFIGKVNKERGEKGRRPEPFCSAIRSEWVTKRWSVCYAGHCSTGQDKTWKRDSLGQMLRFKGFFSGVLHSGSVFPCLLRWTRTEGPGWCSHYLGCFWDDRCGFGWSVEIIVHIKAFIIAKVTHILGVIFKYVQLFLFNEEVNIFHARTLTAPPSHVYLSYTVFITKT